MPRAWIQMPLNTTNVTHPPTSQPTAGQNRVDRRPKCHGRGREDRRANSTALAISAKSWMTVAPISTPLGGLAGSAPAAPAMLARTR
jgi:hypothetical protein